MWGGHRFRRPRVGGAGWPFWTLPSSAGELTHYRIGPGAWKAFCIMTAMGKAGMACVCDRTRALER